ncbi:Hypothetical predicted protein [Marmota monax]|uniref:Uncharacterized protein n=1 Tax=Marmota monax TaxID=9995 RepID=A0A5E4A5C9_MARMO|nr:Hypothetical predicted protein [Marmota monax]
MRLIEKMCQTVPALGHPAASPKVLLQQIADPSPHESSSKRIQERNYASNLEEAISKGHWDIHYQAISKEQKQSTGSSPLPQRNYKQYDGSEEKSPERRQEF